MLHILSAWNTSWIDFFPLFFFTGDFHWWKRFFCVENWIHGTSFLFSWLKKQRIKLNLYSTHPMNQKFGLEGQIKVSSLHQFEGSWSEVYMLYRTCSGCLNRDRNDLWQYPTSVVLLLIPTVLNGWWFGKKNQTETSDCTVRSNHRPFSINIDNNIASLTNIVNNIVDDIIHKIINF